MVEGNISSLALVRGWRVPRYAGSSEGRILRPAAGCGHRGGWDDVGSVWGGVGRAVARPAPSRAGGGVIIRYADDVVVGLQYEREAQQYLRDVRERLAKFGLELHPEKTRVVEFGRFAEQDRKARGLGKPETFDFLGFTHMCTDTRKGKFSLGRKPVAKRIKKTLRRVGEVLRKRWHHDIWEVGRWLGRVLNGWLNYYAFPGSARWLSGFRFWLKRIWMRAIRRRSQRARRFSWKRLERMTEILWPKASIRHPWPEQRFAVNHPR